MRRSNIRKLLFLHCVNANEEVIRTKLLEVIAFMSRSSMYLAQQTNASVSKLFTKKIMYSTTSIIDKDEFHFPTFTTAKNSLRPGKSTAHVADVCAARSSRIVTTKIYSDQPEFSQRDILQFENTPDIPQHLKVFMGLVRARFCPSVLSC